LAIVAGIDEAGYGPLLGPLLVTGVAVRVPEQRINGCLWDALESTCTRAVNGRRQRLAIADSKKLYRGGGSLDCLERAALVMLAAAGLRPPSWRGVLACTTRSDTLDLLGTYPWYANGDFTVPLGPGVGDIGTQANAIRKNAKDAAIEFLGAHCELLCTGQYNELIRKTANKSVVLVGQVMRVIDRLLRTARGERLRIYVDRLGGRQHYRDVLMTAFPSFSLQIVQESPARIAYRLTSGAQVCEVEFVTEGETHRFPIALASIYSKYLRELCMHAFNTFWAAQQPELRPTAGYYSDAIRWLNDAEATIRRLAVDRNTLVRCR
jgi:ribonuclease HII